MKTKLDLLHSQISNRIESRKSENKKYIPDEMKNIARDYEAQFAELMLAEMNKASGSSKGDTASNYYKSLMQKEHAGQLTKNNGGLGVQDMILDEIYPKRLRNEIQYNAYLQQKNRFKRNSITKPEEINSNNQIKLNNSKGIGLSKPGENHEQH